MQGRAIQQEPALDLDPTTLGRPKISGSLLLHLGFAAAIAIGSFAGRFIHHNQWGNQQTPGAIQATLVSSAPAIPLPQDHPPTPNVLATQMPSPAPAPPLPAIAPVPKPDAIPIPERKFPKPKKHKEKPHRESPKNAQPTHQQYKAHFGEAPPTQMQRSVAAPQNNANNPVDVTGGSQGFEYPWYVSNIQRKVSQAWYTQEVAPTTPSGSQVKVTFVISRDGSASQFRILQSSGFPTLDSSAIRAAQRVENFGPLPSGYSKSTLYVEYTFTYRQGSH